MKPSGGSSFYENKQREMFLVQNLFLTNKKLVLPGRAAHLHKALALFGGPQKPAFHCAIHPGIECLLG